MGYLADHIGDRKVLTLLMGPHALGGLRADHDWPASQLQLADRQRGAVLLGARQQASIIRPRPKIMRSFFRPIWLTRAHGTRRNFRIHNFAGFFGRAAGGVAARRSWAAGWLDQSEAYGAPDPWPVTGGHHGWALDGFVIDRHSRHREPPAARSDGEPRGRGQSIIQRASSC